MHDTSCPSCGAPTAIDTPEADTHYVWAVRVDGTRSNLGYCPVVRGLAAAHAEARAYQGRSSYSGNLSDFLPAVLRPAEGSSPISMERALNQIKDLLLAAWEAAPEGSSEEDRIQASLDDVAVMLAGVRR